MSADERLSLEKLELLSGVSARQIRELIRQDVLPPASSGGRGATYGPEHLDRLRAWKRIRQESPPGTTTDQIRSLIDQLHHRGLLQPIADGAIPFALVDDQREEATIRNTSGRHSSPSRPRAHSASEAPMSGTDPLPFAQVNDAAVNYLQHLQSDVVPPARVRVQASSSAPTLEVNLRASGRSSAGVALDRLRLALEDYVRAHAAGVRTSPPRSETWHRVLIGRDLEIVARGPLAADEIQLLETIGQLLQQAVYRRSK